MFSLYFVLKTHIDEMRIERKVYKLNKKIVKLGLELQNIICKYHIYNSMNLDIQTKKYIVIFVSNLIREYNNLINSSEFKIVGKDNINNILNEVEDLLEVMHAGNKIFLELIKS